MHATNMFLLFELIPIPFILLFFFLLFLIPFKLLSSTSKTPKNPPPSAQKLPVIGNLHQIGSTLHLSLQAITQKHGPLVLIHLGSVPVLVVSSAEAAREFLKTHDLIFSSRPKNYIYDILSFGSKDIGFSPYGEYWRQVKSITVLHLLSRKRVQSFRKIREKETIHMIETIGKSCGSVVDVTQLLFLLTNNLLCQAAIGKSYGDHLKYLMDLMARSQYLLGAFVVGSYIPWLSWVDRLRGLERGAKKVAKEFHELLDVVIDEHINNNIKADANNGGKNLLDILLDLQKENTKKFTLDKDTIKAVIFDVFVAGTDATYASVEWALSELVRQPDLMKKLQTEVTEIARGRSMVTEDDMHEMPYLKAVIKESLRLHPPVPVLIPHQAREDVNLMGYDIAKGTQVMVNIWAIARDPLLWEEPEKFNPERFLNSSMDYRGFDFEFLPFGSGRRGCPGTEFAMAASEVVLANIVLKFDLTMPNEKKPIELDMAGAPGLTVVRKSHLLLVPSSRLG
uniref:cytochrome P450 Tp4149-like n=1 Tax=Erigeron canadensis TaxID=72917 RepID=UPI001CB91138|nr:cytochrome P450 Tp4149-like [Erigeron canadensis]